MPTEGAMRIAPGRVFLANVQVSDSATLIGYHPMSPMTQPSFPPAFYWLPREVTLWYWGVIYAFSLPQININTIQGWLMGTKLGVRGPGFLFSSSLSSCVTWAKSFNNSVSSRKWEFSSGTINTCTAYLRVRVKRKMRLLKIKRHSILFYLGFC